MSLPGSQYVEPSHLLRDRILLVIRTVHIDREVVYLLNMDFALI